MIQKFNIVSYNLIAEGLAQTQIEFSNGKQIKIRSSIIAIGETC